MNKEITPEQILEKYGILPPKIHGTWPMLSPKDYSAIVKAMKEYGLSTPVTDEQFAFINGIASN